MKLLTKAVEKSLPPLYSQEKNPDPQVVVKFFNPCGAATWYITEGNWEGEPTNGNPGEDFTMFGLCDLGMGFPELGYVSLNEMKAVRLPFGLGIERDLHWTPQPLSVIKEKVGC
jgi:hypothetical protein